jgi:hypothetical protein
LVARRIDIGNGFRHAYETSDECVYPTWRLLFIPYGSVAPANTLPK